VCAGVRWSDLVAVCYLFKYFFFYYLQLFCCYVYTVFIDYKTYRRGVAMNEEICLDCGNTVRYISDSWVHVDSENVPCFLESQKNWNREVK